MALTLQTGGLAVADWLYWLGRVFADLPEPPVCETLNYMLREGILVADTGILGLGPRGEAEFGRRHFLELVSAFNTSLLLTVRCSNLDLGGDRPCEPTARTEHLTDDPA